MNQTLRVCLMIGAAMNVFAAFPGTARAEPHLGDYELSAGTGASVLQLFGDPLSVYAADLRLSADALVDEHVAAGIDVHFLPGQVLGLTIDEFRFGAVIEGVFDRWRIGGGLSMAYTMFR